MQFFEHQDQARGKTTLLVSLFSLAVICLGAIAAICMHLALSFNTPPGESLGEHHWSTVATAAVVTWGIIFLGSAYRMLQLRSGGSQVAETLGGSLIAPTTTDPLERRVINVVEEMAIASGLPVPPVYLLTGERGINAFAAGWSPDDAVIGVTRGSLEGLTRDQLQGVIAHEFSHILNRDCALNMRLMGILHGIVLISIIGRIVMSMSSGSRHTSTRREGGAVQFFLVGAGLWLFGSLGVLIARLIQSAVSQQREFLADASAVQFTRHPEGIAGALATIGSQSSALSTPRGGETSHMLIGEPGAANFLSALSSHPPLFERISRILPSWNGEFAQLATPPGSVVAALQTRGNDKDDRSEYLSSFGLNMPQLEPIEAALREVPKEDQAAVGGALASLVLEPTAPVGGSSPPIQISELDKARGLLSAISPALRDAAKTPFSCRAVILALILSDSDVADNGEYDGSALRYFSGLSTLQAELPLLREATRLMPQIAGLSAELRLPLFDLCLGTLAGLSAEQKQHHLAQILQIEGALPDQAYGAYCMASLTARHLDTGYQKKRLRPLLIKEAIEVTLSTLANQGHDDAPQAQRAFMSGLGALGQRGAQLRPMTSSELHVARLDAALCTLVKLPFSTRADILSAAEAIARNDGVLRPRETELLRTLAVSLNVAIPASALAAT